MPRRKLQIIILTCLLAVFGFMFLRQKRQNDIVLIDNKLIWSASRNKFQRSYSSICIVPDMFDILNKVIFVADPRFITEEQYFETLSGNVTTLGIFTEPNEFKSNDFKRIQFVYPSIKVYPMKCVDTDAVGAVHVYTQVAEFYVHFFEKKGDYYRICNVGLSKKFSFGDIARSMDVFGLLVKRYNNECNIMVPSSAEQFQFNYNSSKFLDCNRSSMDWLYSKYPEQRADPSIVNLKIKLGLQRLKMKGNSLKKRFFMSGGTLLGWYRQCGIILQSKDVDFAMLKDEFEDNVPNSFRGDNQLYLVLQFGTEPGPLEFRISNGLYTFDLFVLKYDPEHDALIGIYQAALKNYKRRTPPITEICSAELLDMRLLVPCNALEIIENEYGRYPRWLIPRTGSVWKNLRFSEEFNQSYFNCEYFKRYRRNGSIINASYIENGTVVRCPT